MKTFALMLALAIAAPLAAHAGAAVSHGYNNSGTVQTLNAPADQSQSAAQ